MLGQVALGIALMVATTLVHAACTGASLRTLRRIHAGTWALRSHLHAALLIAAVVVALFLAILAEANLWALLYWQLGALASFEEALYFSTVTYTTLGFGDVTLGPEWRLLSSFEAANGTMLLGWSTALVFAFVQRLSDSKRTSEGPHR